MIAACSILTIDQVVKSVVANLASQQLFRRAPGSSKLYRNIVIARVVSNNSPVPGERNNIYLFVLWTIVLCPSGSGVQGYPPSMPYRTHTAQAIANDSMFKELQKIKVTSK